MPAAANLMTSETGSDRLSVEEMGCSSLSRLKAASDGSSSEISSAAAASPSAGGEVVGVLIALDSCWMQPLASARPASNMAMLVFPRVRFFIGFLTRFGCTAGPVSAFDWIGIDRIHQRGGNENGTFYAFARLRRFLAYIPPGRAVPVPTGAALSPRIFPLCLFLCLLLMLLILLFLRRPRPRSR